MVLAEEQYAGLNDALKGVEREEASSWGEYAAQRKEVHQIRRMGRVNYQVSKWSCQPPCCCCCCCRCWGLGPCSSTSSSHVAVASRITDEPRCSLPSCLTTPSPVALAPTAPSSTSTTRHVPARAHAQGRE